MTTQQVSAATWWDFQAIDTMKYSRDKAREWLGDPQAARTIDAHMAAIAATGATHVGIATPYDAEFLPMLKLWVASARTHELKVWFRGNWSGWEGWFEYPRISRDQHLEKTIKFIAQNPSLFEDGDVFSACPECENGGPGDPRNTKDVEAYRDFLISEHTAADQAFKKIGKKVDTTFNSMNGDVARLIMNPATTKALGGNVTVDHYVPKPSTLITDILAFAKSSQGNVILGEFGAPILDLQGSMTPTEQAEWLETVLTGLSEQPHLKGLSYWTHMGGSTELWSSNLEPRPAVAVLTSFYKPKSIVRKVVTAAGKPIPNATAKSLVRSATTKSDGTFELPYQKLEGNLIVTATGYNDYVAPLSEVATNESLIVLQPEHTPTWWERLSTWLKAVFS